MNNAAQTFQAIVNERRSIRAFKSDPVGREVIDAVFAPALRAPSNCNTQPWFVHIVTGDKLEKLRESLPMAFAGRRRRNVKSGFLAISDSLMRLLLPFLCFQMALD